MAGRMSTQNRHYPKGVSRIFQQSVKDLGHKETHTTAESSNVKSEHFGGFNRYGSENKVESNKHTVSSKDRNADVETPEKNVLSHVQVRVSDKRKIPCLFSLEFEEKSKERLSGNGHKSSTYRTSSKSRGHRYSSVRGWARQNRELNKMMSERSASEATINHFNEDWLTDSEDPLTADTPDYGPLQSTPKRQSQENKSTKTKLSTDSGLSECLIFEVEQKLEDQNTNNCVQNVKSENTNVKKKELKNSHSQWTEENLNEFVNGAGIENKLSDERSTSWLSDTDSAVISYCLTKPNDDKLDAHETDVNKDIKRYMSHVNETVSASRSYVPDSCEVSDDKAVKTVSDKFKIDSVSTESNNEASKKHAKISQTSLVRTSPDSRWDFCTKRKISDNIARVSPKLRSDVPPRFKKRASYEMSRDISYQNENFYSNRRVSHKRSGGFGRSVHFFTPKYESWDQQDLLQNNCNSNYKDIETGTKYPKKSEFYTNQDRTNHDKKDVTNEWVVPSSEDWSMEIRDEGLELAKLQGESKSKHQDADNKNSYKVMAHNIINNSKQDEKENLLGSDQNNNTEVDQFGVPGVEVMPEHFQQENTNDMNDCNEIHNVNVQKYNDLMAIHYLPPPPPSEEVKAFEELVDTHNIQAISDKDNDTDEEVKKVCEGVNTKLTLLDNESKKETNKKESSIQNKAIREDVIGNSNKLSESNIFELPYADVQDIKSTCSDYLVDQSDFDCLVVTKSQEGSAESDSGSGDVTDMRKISDIRTQNKGNIQYYNDYDYSNWWNTQQSVSYWNWYYYMYMESYRHTMNWQRGQNNQLTEQQAEWKTPKYTINTNQLDDRLEKKEKNKVEKVPVMDDSLEPDFVAERTNDWVKSHMPEVEARVPPDNSKDSRYRGGKERAGDTKTANLRGYLNEDLKENMSVINNDLNTGVRDSDCVTPSCNCSARDVFLVTWRSCRCSPPTIHGIHSMGDLQSDLGYHSYESVLDMEDSSMLKKSESNDQSGSPLNCQLKLGPKDEKWNQRCPYLYEQIVGNRNLAQSQYVYMLHAKTGHNQVAPPVQPTDNDSCSAIPRSTDEQDENGNKVHQESKPQGSLKALVEDINQNYRKTVEHSSAFSPYSGQSGIREHFLTQRYQENSMERSQELSGPLVQSEAHLSEVNKTLSNAEKTNSQLGKSVSVMKDAIAAIKRYTDQLKSEMNCPETTVDINANVAAKSVEGESETSSVKNDKYRDSDVRNVRDVSNEHGKENVMLKMRVKPFQIKRRENKTYESSCEPFSESSDEICKDSMLSQSPSTRMKLDDIIARHVLATSYSDKVKDDIQYGLKSLKTGNFDDDESTEEQTKTVPKLSLSYRGRGTSPASLRSSVVDCKGIGHLSDTSSLKSDPLFEPRPGVGASIRQPLKPFPNPWFNLSGQRTPNSPFISKNAMDQHKTPQKQICSSEGFGNPSRPTRRRKTLVQYTVSDDSSSENEEIRPFDVDSLSSDLNPGSNENIFKSVKEQYRPKKLKHDTTSDDDSTSTPPIRKVVEKPKKEPVTFLKRPPRKLNHKQLKDLPSDDISSVHFSKKGASETKSQTNFPKTMAEFISLHQEDSKDRQNATKDLTMSVNPPCGAIEVPSRPQLPPLPPFPQSQFWSMYLPKYNSALTGKEESTSITPDVKRLSTSPVTPEMKRTTMRRSWGGAGCAIGSPSASDAESDKGPGNEWKASFRRFHNFGVKYIDTHCHLDFLFKREGFCGNLRDYMEKNQELFPDTFEGCVAVFCNPVTFNPRGGLWREVANEDNVWFAMGCHPKMATDFTEISEAGLRECLKHEKCVALGEIGLDYSGTFQQHEDIQKEVFRKQLTIALEMNKPLVIHCRDAEQDCLDILKEMVPRDYKIHCHCFTGYYYNAKLWMEAFPNLYIGVTPLVTYRTATPSHDLARHIPLNRLLLETDAPYFVPKGVPKDWLMFSSPGLAVTVAKEIAQYQELPVAAVLRHCRLNTKFMYGI